MLRRIRQTPAVVGLACIARDLMSRTASLIASSTIPGSSVEFLMASHVLEHIKEDEAAIAEVVRVLSPGGIAILPVPIVAPRTIEYPRPVPTEFHHVRAPGLDYYDRYRKHFARVEVHTSEDFGEELQT